MEEGTFATIPATEAGKAQGGDAVEANPAKQEKKGGVNWAIWGTLIAVVGFVVLIIILVVVGAGTNGNNGDGNGGEQGNTHRCLGDGVCEAVACDPFEEEDCFASQSECQAVCGQLDAWTCSNNACVPSPCDPENDSNCYASKGGCKEECQIFGYTCEGVAGQCSRVQCDPDDAAGLDGGCYKSETSCINGEDDCAPSGTECNPQGTRRREGSQCICWDGVTGDKCDRCMNSYGPKFPCCFLKAITFRDEAANNVPGYVPPCYTRTFKTSDSGESKNLVRSCATREGGCWAAPTYNILATDKNAGGLKRRARCGEWIDTRTGRAVTFADYDTPEEYKKDFERYTADGTWIPGGIYCRTSADPNSWSTANYEEFSEACVASTQVDSCFLNPQTGKPEVFSARQGTDDITFVHP